MLVLGIYGSPRKGGNTDLLLDAFLEGSATQGAAVQKIYVRDMRIKGCKGCGRCDKTGVCVQKDDMVRVYPLLDEAAGIVVASPIYFYGVTGQLKLLIDRSQATYMRREIERREGKAPTTAAGRRGFMISAGATRGKRLFECAILSVKYFFDALDVEYAGELCYREIDRRGDILNRPEAVEDSRRAGMAFALEV